MHIHTDIHICKTAKFFAAQTGQVSRKAASWQAEKNLFSGPNEHPTHLFQISFCEEELKFQLHLLGWQVLVKISLFLNLLPWLRFFIALMRSHLKLSFMVIPFSPQTYLKQSKMMFIYICWCVCVSVRASKLISSFATDSIYYSSRCSLFRLSPLILNSLECEGKTLCPYLGCKQRT